MITTKKSATEIRMGQKAIADYIQARIPEKREKITAVNEFPLSFPKGAIFTFGKINSVDYTHGLHSYPAKFVPQIPRWAMNYAKVKDGDLILDPFCGSGTTLVEASLKGISSYGIDVDSLARLLSKVKCTPLYSNKPELIFAAANQLMGNIRTERSKISLENQPDVNLHFNWRFWFKEDVMKELIKIKRCIRSFDPPFVSDDIEKQDVRDFFIICLSSVVKRVSFLDEEQIKVKKSERKVKNGVVSPVIAFDELCKKNAKLMVSFTKAINRLTKTTAKIIGNDARSIPLDNQSIKLIVTSPPYINAIDYPFAHKYELFILDLVKPQEYRPYSRTFIGVSERVLLKRMYEKLHLSEYEPVDSLIKTIYSLGKDVDKNRAYVVFQYFTGMEKFLNEARRVLSDDGCLVIFVGDNHIRRIYIPTHELLMRMAEKKFGFKCETFFYHQLKKKKFGLPRHESGDEISREMGMVLRKD